MRLGSPLPLLLPPLLLAGLSLTIGSVAVPIREVIAAVAGTLDPESVNAIILLDIRLPRVLVALGGGAMLALAGLIMQTVFRNALAGPGVLGVGSGAGLGVAVVMLSPVAGRIATPTVLAATAGALFVLTLILTVDRYLEQTVLVLVLGLLFSYAASALAQVLMAGADPEGLQRYVYWSFGSFAVAPGWPQIAFPPAAIGATVLLRALASRMDTLLLGDLYAESSGIDLRVLRRTLLLVAGVLVGLCTAVCGPIAFLGVAVPHIARGIAASARHRFLVPATALIGASLAVTADLVSRLPGSDRVLPLNAVLSLVGVPVIVVVLLRSGRGRLSL